MTDQVLTKAQEKFGDDLYPAEEKLFREFGTVQTIKFSKENRILRADRLSWLCRESEFWKLCLPHGIDIEGADIFASLDLRLAKIEVPLRFSNCQFHKALLLKQAELKELDLSGSQISSSDEVNFPGNPPEPTSISAKGIKVEGSIYLSNGFKAEGCVVLYSAEIGANLECTNATFSNSNGYALLAPDINVKGSVFLDQAQASGCVILYGAEIGANLECTNATFSNSNGNALLATDINVKGSVFLNQAQASGCVDLQGAEIGGGLGCTNSKFESSNGYALLAQSINVKGSVFLDQAQASGCVDLCSAEIGGGLVCTNATFSNSNGNALLAQSINVKGSVFLDQAQASGGVSLQGAEIGGGLFCPNATFSNSNGYALLAQSINVKGSVFLSNQFQADGCVSLSSAEIGANLVCTNATFSNSNGNALLAQSINVKGSVFLDQAQASGCVSLYGGEIGVNLECTNSKFESSNGNALLAQSINVKGSVSLNQAQASGCVSLYSAEIGGTLQINNVGDLKDKFILNLQFAKVKTVNFYKNSFPNPGNLYINGLVYDLLGTGSLNTYNARELLEWLELQPDENFSFQPYTQLAKVLQSSGKENIATQILIAKENRRYDIIENPLEKLWGEILRIIIAYGYRPWRVFIWATAIIYIGYCFFDHGYKYNLIYPTDKECINIKIGKCKNYPKFDALVYSVDVFLPIIDLRLKNAWLPKADDAYGRNLRYYFWFQTLAGWVLTTIWVAGFTGLVRNNKE
jgi:hypothetical protein